MNRKTRAGAWIGLGAALMLGLAVRAEAKETIRIGVLTDMVGFTSDYTGQGSVIAARMAIDDFRAANDTFDIDLVTADHQLKADVASTVARRWFDRDGVDVVVDVPGSAIVLALSQVVKDKNKVLLSTSSSSSRITGADCSPNTINWTYSTWALANGTGNAVVRQGGSTWFFITPDWEYGRSIEADTTKVIVGSGGKVLGSVLHPIGTGDFSSYLLQAQASKAKIVALTSGGSDMVNGLKQADEFGIVAGGQKLATLFFSITDAHAVGLKVAQGLQFTTAFYWDQNERTRAFGKRFMALRNGRAPTDTHAAVYSSTTAYLRAAAALGSVKDGQRVVAQMRAFDWFDDPLFARTRVRKDGTVEHAMHLVEVKSPAASKGPWDYYTMLDEIPAEKAFQPMSETGCPFAAN